MDDDGSRLHVQRDDFARFTLGKDLERPAADFAVGREPLLGDAGVHQQFHRLAAVGTLDALGFLHGLRITGTPAGATSAGQFFNSKGAVTALASFWWAP